MPVGEPKCGLCGSDLVSGMFHHCSRPVECPGCASMKLELAGMKKVVDAARDLVGKNITRPEVYLEGDKGKYRLAIALQALGEPVKKECQHVPCICDHYKEDPICVHCDRIIGHVK